MPGKPLDPPRPQCPWRDHAGSLCLQTPGCFQFTHLHQNGALPPMPTSPDASSTQMSPKHPAEFTVTVSGPLCECFHSCVTDKGASLVAQVGKNPPAMWETHVPSLGWEDPLEKGMAAHSHILAWRIPQRSLAGYSPLGQKRVRQDSQLTLSPSLQIKSLRCWGDPPSCAIFTLMSAGQQHVCVCVCVCVFVEASLSLSHLSHPWLEADTPPLNISHWPPGDPFFTERLCCPQACPRGRASPVQGQITLVQQLLEVNQEGAWDSRIP